MIGHTCLAVPNVWCIHVSCHFNLVIVSLEFNSSSSWGSFELSSGVPVGAIAIGAIVGPHVSWSTIVLSIAVVAGSSTALCVVAWSAIVVLSVVVWRPVVPVVVLAFVPRSVVVGPVVGWSFTLLSWL